jgi:beta-lactamase regulating signal transducer with metallopeptidase domain
MTRLLAQTDLSMLVGTPVLARWGAALAHFLWQGAALAMLALVLLGLLKRARPQIRYAALVCILAVMAACPVVTFWRFASEPASDSTDLARSNRSVATSGTSVGGVRHSGDPVPLPSDLMSAGVFTTATTASSQTSPPIIRRSPLTILEQGRGYLEANVHWLALAWCAGVGLLSLRLVVGIVGVERAKRDGARPAPAVDITVAALARKLRVCRSVRVLESAMAEVPITIGWLRPYILLPASALTGLTAGELESVLAHELAHVRRHDYLVNVIQIVIETFLFYHPAVWWLSGRIRREREHCCDDWAVAVCGNRMTFARALVTLEGLRAPACGLALAASGGSLRERVLRLVGRPAANRSGWRAAALVVLVTLAAVGIGAVVSTRAQENESSRGRAGQGGQKGAPAADDVQKDIRGRDSHIAWGKAKNGLKVGLTLAEHARERYAVGEVVPLELVAQNVSDLAIVCTYPIWPYFSAHPLRVRDAQDQDVSPPKMKDLQGMLYRVKRIEPGETVVIADRGVEFRNDPDWCRFWAYGGPGKYQVSQEIALSTPRTKTGKMPELGADADAYETGTLELVLVEATADAIEKHDEADNRKAVYLRAPEGKHLRFDARDRIGRIEGGSRMTMTGFNNRTLELEAERISLTLRTDGETRLAGQMVRVSFPSEWIDEVLCAGNVRLKLGQSNITAQRMSLDFRRKRFLAENVVVTNPNGLTGEARWLEGTIDENLFALHEHCGIERAAPDVLPAATWGEVRNGWQLGLRWKSGGVEHSVGEEAWYEVVARNPGQSAVALEYTKGEHSDVTLYAGNQIRVRFHGQERTIVALSPGEERMLDVWRSRLATDGLPAGDYSVAIQMPDDDTPAAPPPLGLRLTPPDGPAGPAVHDLKGRAAADEADAPVADAETIAWGEPVLGLQAGMRYARGGPRRRIGTTVEADVFVRNTTKHGVEIEYLHRTPLDFVPEVRDAEGRRHEALMIITGPKFEVTKTLPPGRPVLVGGAQFKLQTNGESPSVEVLPGEYRYSTWLHIRGTSLAYVGVRLATAELPLEIVASTEGGLEIRSPFDARKPANRKALLEIGGGSAESEAAVEKALDWLARHQNKNGSWSIHDYDRQCNDLTCTGQGAVHSDVASTAMGLLPFLGAGWTHQSTEGPYAKSIDGGLKYLVGKQAANGDLSGGPYTMYAHGLATIALAEAYGMTNDPDLGKAVDTAVRFIEAAQHATTGGWRYSPGQEGDTSVLGWQVTALASARMAGIAVKDATFDGARRFLKSVAAGDNKGRFCYTPGAGPTPTLTASGLLCSQHLGMQRDSPVMNDGVEFLLQNQPASDKRNLYYWHYATQVMHNLPGPQWDDWNRKIQAALIESQEQGGCAEGSWDPQKPFPDPWGQAGGRLMATSLSCLALEVYYRYLPLYQPDGGNAK